MCYTIPMKMLIAYATYSSSTESASKVIESVLSQSHEVTRKNIKEVIPDELHNYDVILFGSPSWWNRSKDGQPHEFFLEFMDSMQGKRVEKPFAIFGNGDSAYTHFTGAVDVLEQFVDYLGGKKIAPSLRIDGYYFDQPGNEKLVKEWAETVHSKLSE